MHTEITYWSHRSCNVRGGCPVTNVWLDDAHCSRHCAAMRLPVFGNQCRKIKLYTDVYLLFYNFNQQEDMENRSMSMIVMNAITPMRSELMQAEFQTSLFLLLMRIFNLCFSVFNPFLIHFNIGPLSWLCKKSLYKRMFLCILFLD